MLDLSAFLPTFVITLREGVEAALAVGIVLALLKKAQRSQLNPWVYAGVLAGLFASVLVGVIFTGILQTLQTSNQLYAPVVESRLEGVFSLIAIAMLTWMPVGMTQQAKSAKAEVAGAVSAALQ